MRTRKQISHILIMNLMLCHNFKTRINKLVYMLEKSEKTMSKRLKESRKEIENITVIINKFWKIMNRQIG